MKIKIGLALILAILSLTLSVQAQSGANRQSNQEKKKRSTETNQQTQAENSATETVSDDEIVNVNTDLVTIPVSVYDREGRFVPGLKKEDFQVFENNKQQEIAYFAPVEQPFTVALVLDVSLSTKFKIDQIQTAAYQFVMGLRPADKVMIVSFDEEVRFLSEPTNDRETLRLAINRARFGGGTSLYEAVYQTLERMKKIAGRKAIVLFTDGVDTSSRATNDADNLYQAQEFEGLIYTIHYDTYEDVQAQMRNPPILNPNPVPGSPVPLPTQTPTIPGTNIPFPQLPQRRRDDGRYPRNPSDPRYPGDPNDPRNPNPQRPNDPTNRDPRDDRDVIITGGGTTSQEYRRGREYLDKLTANAGGRLYEANSALALSRAFDQIAEELRRQYSLGYYPQTEGRFGERRNIKVKVNRPKTAVRARETYTVGKKERKGE